MEIRKAKISDKDEVVDLLIQMQKLHQKNRPDIFKKLTKQDTEKEFAEIMENEQLEILVAIDESNKICGLCTFKIKEVKDHVNLKDAKILYIQKIGIEEKCRRKGIGKIVMKEINKIAKKLNCDRVELSCWSFNSGAIEFYKSQNMKIQRLNMEIGVD